MQNTQVRQKIKELSVLVGKFAVFINQRYSESDKVITLLNVVQGKTPTLYLLYKVLFEVDTYAQAFD